MAKSKSFFGLRTGSTKTHTYQILGGMQITKARVERVANPQTSAQMIQRVVFATVTQAADKMLPIIGISQQGVTNETESRRRWISQNVKLLREAAQRMNKGGATEAAFAPKGNAQLIPNSYQMSKGSLSLANALVPKTTAEGGASFGSKDYAEIGDLGTLTQGVRYTSLDLWRILFGLYPGDQLTFPQIYGDGTAQEMYGASGATIDRTQYTQFVAPRIVLHDAVDGDEGIVFAGETQASDIIAELQVAVNTEISWFDARMIFDNHLDVNNGTISLPVSYDTCFAVNNDDPLLAIGCIRSHKNVSNGKWEYSTSRLVCAWTLPIVDYNYFGFTLPHAVDTYLKAVTMDGEGNFLQTGTDAQIVPESFT